MKREQNVWVDINYFRHLYIIYRFSLHWFGQIHLEVGVEITAGFRRKTDNFFIADQKETFHNKNAVPKSLIYLNFSSSFKVH